MRVATAFVLIIILIVGAAFVSKINDPQIELSDSSEPTPVVEDPQLRLYEVVAGNLDTPWDIDFLPNGKMFVTEREGTVSLIDNEGNVEQIANLENVREVGEGGLLGLAVEPDFENNNNIYFYYTYSSSGNNTRNRVVRMKLQDNILSDEEILIDNIPGASNHNGGQIAFGPDDNLYFTTGDAQEPSEAQNTNSLAGKILRYSNGDVEVYSYGHRNPQGIAWDRDGNLWATEHGRSGVQSGLDEINLIQKGDNYGWPEIQGDETQEDMVTPVINSGNTTWAPSGIAVIGNKIYFGGLRGNALYSTEISGDSLSSVVEHFKSDFGRIRAVVAGPDDMLYVSTSNRDGRGNPTSEDDRIIRINPHLL